MNKGVLAAVAMILAGTSIQAIAEDRYIEVTGTSEIEIDPDRIHYIIEIKEYFEEEFDGKSKPEEFHTKVPLSKIESSLKETLSEVGIAQGAIRTYEVGDYWRRQGQDFLISKTFDITLSDFRQIDAIVKRLDTRGINNMHVGDMENDRMQEYHERGKIEALKAAQRKAAYLAAALDEKVGKVLRIVEQENGIGRQLPQSNVISSDAGSYESFRTIKRKYSMMVRFEIIDQDCPARDVR